MFPIPWMAYLESGLHLELPYQSLGDFPDSSVGKEYTCNAGDPSSIPGLGRFAGEGIGYPFQYSWVSLVAQLVKNLPAMRETWVQWLGRSPGKGKGYPFQYSGLENSMDCIVHGVTKSQNWWNDFHFSLSVLAPSMSHTSVNCHIIAAQCESPRGLSHCQRASDCRYIPNFKEEHLWSLGITVCVVLLLPLFQIFPAHAVVRNLPANIGDPRDLGLIPKSWNSPRRENGNLLQYYCLESWWTEEPVGLHPSGMTEHACMHPLPSNLQVPFFTSPQIKKCQTRSIMSLKKTGLNIRRNWRDLHDLHFTQEKT